MGVLRGVNFGGSRATKASARRVRQARFYTASTCRRHCLAACRTWPGGLTDRWSMVSAERATSDERAAPGRAPQDSLHAHLTRPVSPWSIPGTDGPAPSIRCRWSRAPGFGRLQRQAMPPDDPAACFGIARCTIRAQDRPSITSRSPAQSAPTDGERSNLGLLRNSWCSPDRRGYRHPGSLQGSCAALSP